MSTNDNAFDAAAASGASVLGAAVAPQPTLRITNLSKTFGDTTVLDSFNLTIDAGSIHVLVGQNGSGKSTLIKVLSGYHQPDSGGRVLIGDEELQFNSPESAYRLGCRFVHQDLGLVLTRSVLDNLSLTSGYPTRFGTIRNRSTMATVREALERVGLDIDPRRKVSDFTAAERTGIALARVLREDPLNPPKLLVLDEPTAALPAHEVNHLLGMLRAIAANGISVLFVTHHLNEVFLIGDVVTVLRNGQQVGTFPIGEIDRSGLIELLVGGEITKNTRRSGSTDLESVVPALQVTDLSTDTIDSVSFSASRGEVVGIAGLTGSGSESILEAIFGSIRRYSGEVSVGGKRVVHNRPDRSIRAGMGFLPPDRVANGGVMTLSATENITLPNLKPYWGKWRISKRRQSADSLVWFERFDVRPGNDTEKTLSMFSGGNQQKILLAKWLHLRPSVLLLNEPTQGVDVGAKADIHHHILAAAQEGLTVIVSSSDNEELATLCDRVLIIRKGRIQDEIMGDQLTDSNISRSVVAEAE